MPKLSRVKGTTSDIVHIFVPDSSSTIGAGLTGLAFNSGNLTAYYVRPGDSAPTAITLATATLGTWATGGFKEESSSNMPGVYEFGIPNACLATGAKQVVIMLRGATNMAPVLLEIELTAVDNQSAAFGLSLAKTTNLTGLNDIAATAIVSGGAITTSSGAVSRVTLTDTITAYTGNTLQTGDAFARLGAAGAGLTALGDTRIANLDATVTSRKADYAQPTGFLAATFPGTVASPTNITAGALTTVTTLTNLPTITTDWITAAGISAAAVTKIQAGLSTYGGADTSGTTTLLARVTGAVALAASLPANFSTLGINSSGHISRVTLTDAVTDKAGFALTAGERTSIANEVEAQIIDETDSEKVLTAITDKIASVNPSLGSLTVAAIASASATAVWGSGTKALTDKSGFALTQAFPANFSTFGINSSGHVLRATLVDTTTVNTDMRGTDGAITSLAGIATGADVTAAQTALTVETDALSTLLTTLTDADGIELGVSMLGAVRALLATSAGRATGGNTNTITFKNPAGTVVRVTMQVDADGNRSGITLG